MIFVTVGTQLPFDRLIQAVDEIKPMLGEPVFAQTGSSDYDVENFEAVATLRPHEFREKMEGARVVVSHAGIGTLLVAKQLSKPIILFPRRADLGEHRNDHQMATARQLEHAPGVYIAWDHADLHRLLMGGDLVGAPLEAGTALQNLRSVVARFCSEPPR